jgi:Tfp pilus assembly PilM family ATPase
MKIGARPKSMNLKKDSTALLIACGLALRSFD